MTMKIDDARARRVEQLGQALDHAEPEAGDDRADDRAHAADHHHREHDDDQVAAHQRADLVDRRGHHAAQAGQADAEAVGEHQHARHVDAEGAHQRRVLVGRAQVGAELGALDDEPGRHADRERRARSPTAGTTGGRPPASSRPPADRVRIGLAAWRRTCRRNAPSRMSATPKVSSSA